MRGPTGGGSGGSGGFDAEPLLASSRLDRNACAAKTPWKAFLELIWPRSLCCGGCCTVLAASARLPSSTQTGSSASPINSLSRELRPLDKQPSWAAALALSCFSSRAGAGGVVSGARHRASVVVGSSSPLPHCANSSPLDAPLHIEANEPWRPSAQRGVGSDTEAIEAWRPSARPGVGSDIEAIELWRQSALLCVGALRGVGSDIEAIELWRPSALPCVGALRGVGSDIEDNESLRPSALLGVGVLLGAGSEATDRPRRSPLS